MKNMNYNKEMLNNLLLKELEDAEKEKQCLVVKTTNQWINEAKQRPIPKMLFSEFWYENELSILFADTNTGKSVLAMQIANSISKGEAIHGFKFEAGAQNVLYLDFELSDKQLEKRFSNNYQNHYQFSDKFYRAELDTNIELPKVYKTLEDYITAVLEDYVVQYDIKVIIVDNITYLNADNEKAKDALILMKRLKQLKTDKIISVLVLAHSPKRDNSKPISKNDIAGSKMLINFCDSAFAIGFSSLDSSTRYLKQIKQRNTEHIYDTENVVVCSLIQNYNFLQFEFVEYDSELNHLKVLTSSSLEQRDEEMANLINEGISNVQIGQRLGISESAVRKRRKKLGL